MTMLGTIRHQDHGELVVVAKLLTGYDKVDSKVTDIDSYIKVNDLYDADFVAYTVSWQTSHGCTPDGIIGPETWRAIAKAAPTCSTSRNRTSGYTLAIQLLLDGNISCDAIYGPRTKAAVVAFQDAHKLDADGICGPKTWAALVVGADDKPVTPDAPTASTGFAQPVDYKQGDSRWGKKMYSNHGDKNQTMSNSGCGPTACADVVATLKDAAVTPWTLAQLAMEWGDRTDNSGTAWAFFERVAKKYSFVKFVQSKTWDALTACLDAGGYVVCSMGPGYWTSGGHYICVWKYDGTYVYANDPASNTRKRQKIRDFKSQRKQYFCFYPDPKPKGLDSGDEESATGRGTKICDISHHQPTVDYDAFVRDTALIILRPGYRSTDGPVKIDTCFIKHADAMKARGVRFGTYFYSLANTEEKAREEARMYYKWAKDYKPLFWSIDAEKDLITTAAIVAFVDELRKLGAKKVGVYCANHLYNKFDYASIREQMDFTWIPKYSANPPVYPCDLWQYTDMGQVGGIGRNVDLNKITGDGHTLAWFCGGE
jgi:peptidoglycan hydrolase-like protein with peptidoglycan-binding domain/GH25 family lysozyme M1 (1,4-beta-N-acetylmuramidase)